MDTAAQAVQTARRLMALTEEDSQRIQELKRTSGSVHLVHKAMLKRPIASPNWVQEETQLVQAIVNACLSKLEELGIVKEVTGQQRNRLYSYVAYIEIMKEGTELPS